MQFSLRLRRRVAASLALASCLVVVAATSSWATTSKSVNGGSTCSNYLVKTGTSKGALHSSGYSYAGIEGAAATAHISTSYADVENDSCVSGNGLATSTLSVSLIWRITFTGVTSCTAGFPLATCTVSGNEVTYTSTKKCTNVSRCTYSWANEEFVYPSAGAKVSRILFQVRYNGQQSGKTAVSGTTTGVTWP